MMAQASNFRFEFRLQISPRSATALDIRVSTAVSSAKRSHVSVAPTSLLFVENGVQKIEKKNVVLL